MDKKSTEGVGIFAQHYPRVAAIITSRAADKANAMTAAWHTPVSFNRQLFGPGAGEAMKVYRNAMNDPELAGLLGLFGSTEMVVPRFRRQGDVSVGIDDKGAEIVRVPLREPVHIRPALDAKNQLVRINCP